MSEEFGVITSYGEENEFRCRFKLVKVEDEVIDDDQTFGR